MSRSKRTAEGKPKAGDRRLQTLSATTRSDENHEIKPQAGSLMASRKASGENDQEVQPP